MVGFIVWCNGGLGKRFVGSTRAGAAGGRELDNLLLRSLEAVLGVYREGLERAPERSVILAMLRLHGHQDVRDRAAILGALGFEDRKSTRLNSSHVKRSRMPSSA